MNATRRRRASPVRIASTAFAFLLAAGLLYFSLRGIDWSGAWTRIRGARVSYLVLASAMVSAMLFLRSFRWRILLLAERPVGIGTAFWATCAGYFGNSFLPARAGELVRTFLVSSSSGLSGAYVLATALSERIADAVTLVVISAAVMLGMSDPPGWLARAAKPFAILGACGLLALALAPKLDRFGHRVLSALPVPHGLRDKLARVLDQGLRGIRSFHDAKRLLGFAALTVMIWSGDAVSTMLGVRALHLTIGFPAALLLLAGLGLGSALPSTPGYVGIYQFVAVSILVPFGFTRTDAIAYILVAQAVQYVLIGCWGAAGFVRFRRSAPDLPPVA